MPIDLILITFTLLAFSIALVWVTPYQIGKLSTIFPWYGCFIAAMLCGVVAGILDPIAMVQLGLFSIAAYLTMAAEEKSKKKLFFTVLTIIMALAFALHRFGGFNNPVIISNVVLSEGAAPFTQYANFDKGAAGLILLAFLCYRTQSFTEFGELMKRTVPIALFTIALVMGVAIGVGYVRPDFKLSFLTLLFLATNLFFVVVAEEAFFRGFLQARLTQRFAHFRWGWLLAVLISAGLFGVAHAAGGMSYVLLAAIAGFGYAMAWQVTRRIEASIFVHFAVNAVHFVGFTYPHLSM